MISEEHRDLISEGAEGKLSESEYERLERIILQDNEARQLFDELSLVNESLLSVRTVSPPAEVKSNILSLVERSPRKQLKLKSSFGEVLMGSLSALFSPARIATFAGGMAVGIIGFLIYETGADSVSSLGLNRNLTGSMILDPATLNDSFAAESFANQSFTTQAEIDLKRASGFVGVTFQGSSASSSFTSSSFTSLSFRIDTDEEFAVEIKFEDGQPGLIEWRRKSSGEVFVESGSSSTKFNGVGMAEIVAVYESDGDLPSKVVVSVAVAEESQELVLLLKPVD